MKRSELNKLLQAAKYAGQATLQLKTIDTLKLKLSSRNQFNSQLQQAYEALEFLKLKIEDIITNEVS
jgi:hypothetical protein